MFDSLASLGEPLQQDLQQPACFSMDEVSDRKGTDLLESRLLTRNTVTEENWNEGSHTLWFWFWFGSQFLDNLDLFSSSFLYPFLFLRSLCFWLITRPGLGQLMSSARCESIWNRQQLLLSFCTKVVFWSFCTAFVAIWDLFLSCQSNPPSRISPGWISHASSLGLLRIFWLSMTVFASKFRKTQKSSVLCFMPSVPVMKSNATHCSVLM